MMIKILFLFSTLASLTNQANSLNLPVASAAAATTTTAAVLKDYSGVASGLFNNMRTPAALISGAIVPLGLLSAPQIDEKECKKMQLLKKANMLLAIASLLSEILAITYSTVAINKLAEVQFPHTSGVSELLSKHFELAWIGSNIHFITGMFGFGLLVGTKAYFTYEKKVGKIAFCWSIGAFLQCTSIMNQGISLGQGPVDGISSRFAKNLFSLMMKYTWLIVKKAKEGSLSFLALAATMYSLFLTIQIIIEAFTDKNE